MNKPPFLDNLGEVSPLFLSKQKSSDAHKNGNKINRPEGSSSSEMVAT